MRLLESLGYTDVKHYSGGIRDWLDHDRSLDEGSTSKPESVNRSVAEPPSTVRPMVSRGRSATLLMDALGDRTVGQLLGLWLEMVLGFGVAYWALGWMGIALVAGDHAIGQGWRGFLSSEYFSFVTALSVGYGDLVPRGIARVLAVVEAAAGLLVFGVVISKFVSRRQEELIHEIHLTTFMDRLARVRTNLHMVLSELHAMLAICVDRRGVGTVAEQRDLTANQAPTDRIVVRAESVSLVFLGELRSIHDLLYRPQQAPDESILEGLLAELAAVLGELAELYRCLPSEVPRSPTLEAANRSISAMALEICGDCVPRQYAPHLKVWMDRVQDLGRALGSLWPVPQ